MEHNCKADKLSVADIDFQNFVKNFVLKLFAKVHTSINHFKCRHTDEQFQNLKKYAAVIKPLLTLFR